MSERRVSPVTFTTGCAINGDMYYAACSPDAFRGKEDASHTVMCFYQRQTSEKWFYHELPEWRVMSVAFIDSPPGSPRKVYALSEQGEVECYSREGSEIERIADAGLIDPPSGHGYVSRIRPIGGKLYVCGFKGQVYRRERSGWIHFDDKLLQRDGPPQDLPIGDPDALLKHLSGLMNDTRDLIDIDGLGEEDIYVVGSDGFIAHHDGSGWRVLDRPTAASLHAVHARSSDDVWIVGSRGTVLRGNAEAGFKALSRRTLDADFYSVASFGGEIYIAANNGIYRMVGDKPEILPISREANLAEVSSIEAKDGVLWALSSKALLRFDGSRWERFYHPNNP